MKFFENFPRTKKFHEIILKGSFAFNGCDSDIIWTDAKFIEVARNYTEFLSSKSNNTEVHEIPFLTMDSSFEIAPGFHEHQENIPWNFMEFYSRHVNM